MFALLCFGLVVSTLPFKSKSRLEAENAALRHQLIVLWRKARTAIAGSSSSCIDVFRRSCGSIAHEINQPLGAIATNTEAALVLLAKIPPDYDEVQGALKDIVTATARGGQVIEGLRAMFKKGEHRRASFDVNELVREALAMLEVNLRTERVSVSTELREGLPQLLADRGQLQQVFLNLITNAVEAMRPVTDRARQLRITSDIVQEGADILIAVEDSGSGIDEKSHERIFEPFFTTKSAGTGMGLTICRSIIDSHGGTLRASPNSPHGTMFQIVFPIAAEGARRGLSRAGGTIGRDSGSLI